MFIGHFAPALLARAVSADAPKLGTLFVAAQLVDVAFFGLVILGVERIRIVPGITAMNPLDLYRMPYTHSLVATTMWALALACFLLWRTRRRAAAAWAAMVVLSHWVLDLVVHRPDLTIAGLPPKLGLGLWDHPWIAIPLELGVTLCAFWFYLRRTRGPVMPPVILLVTLLLLQAINWFGPQPREYTVGLPLLALFAFGVLIGLAAWVGDTRWHKREVGLAVASVRR